MKKIALIALALLFTTPVLALDPYARNDPNPGYVDKGIQTYNPKYGANERIGVTCSLYLDYKKVHDGYCKIGRRDDVTLISTGSSVYKIVRDSRNVGKFYRGVNSDVYYGVVTTQGNCWSSPETGRVQFCAD
jgi:hypothetical protein